MIQKGSAPILIVLIIAAAVGGYFVFTTNYSNKRINVVQTVQTPTPTGVAYEPVVPNTSVIPLPSSSPPPPVLLAWERLAYYLAIPSSSIQLLSIKEVVWPNTCLGLPAPEMCAPGETQGYVVVFSALGTEYRYHTDQGELFRFAGPGEIPQRPSQ